MEVCIEVRKAIKVTGTAVRLMEAMMRGTRVRRGLNDKAMRKRYMQADKFSRT